MPRFLKVFNDPKVNEYIYDFIVNCSKEKKASLSPTELSLISTPGETRRFISTGNLEKILSILTKLGLQWNLSFFNRNITVEDFKKTYTQYSADGKFEDAVESMLSKKMFVTGSREVAICLSMMASTCHSDVYMINPAFYNFSKLNKSLLNKGIKEAKLMANNNASYLETMHSSSILTKICLTIMRLDVYLSSVYNLRTLDLMILWTLFLNKDQYVSISYLRSSLGHWYKPQSIGNRAMHLFSIRKMIDKRPSAERLYSYKIMQEGILLIGDIQQYILKQAND